MSMHLKWALGVALLLGACQKEIPAQSKNSQQNSSPEHSNFAFAAPDSWESKVWSLISQNDFKTVQGSPWSLQSHPEAQVIAVNFWGTYCPPCIAEMPLLDSLYRQYQGKFAVLGLSEEDPKDLERFLKRKALSYPIPYLSEAQIQSPALTQVTSVPVTVFFDRQGHLLGSVDGMVEKPQIEAILKAAHFFE